MKVDRDVPIRADHLADRGEAFDHRVGPGAASIGCMLAEPFIVTAESPASMLAAACSATCRGSSPRIQP